MILWISFAGSTILIGAVIGFALARRQKTLIDAAATSHTSSSPALPQTATQTHGHPIFSFQKEWAADKNFTRRQRLILMVAFALFVWGMVTHTILTIQLTLAATSLVFFASTILRAAYIAEGLRHPLPEDPPLFDTELPSYTVLVALYHEDAVAKQLCKALAGLDYPSDLLQVLLVCEEHDLKTIEALQQHLYPGQSVLVVPQGSPQTKPRALNFALKESTGELLTIYDAEDRPEPDQLRKAAAGFANRSPEVAALQARLDIYNPKQSWVSSLFSLEYLTLFAAAIPGLARFKHAMPLGGTSTHFKTDIIRRIGGWDAWNVTEDCELGMRIAATGYRSDVIDSATWEEAVSSLPSWTKQRSRWIKGYAQTCMVMLRRPIVAARGMGWKTYTAALLTVGGVPAVLMAQVITWGLMLYYLVGMIKDGHMTQLQTYFVEPLGSLTLLGLVGGLVMVIWVNAAVAHLKGRNRLVAFSLLLPVYILMASYAAWKGCLQLIYKPHFWEKTQHGGSIGQQEAALIGATERVGNAGVSGSTQPLDFLLKERSRIARKIISAVPERKPMERGLLASLWGSLAVSLGILWFGHDSLENFSDATSHLMTPARIWDNLSPGLDQLGLHWLPLHHLLQTPMSWYGPLLYSGASGAIVSILATLVAVGFLYRLARHVGAGQGIAFLSCLGLLAAPSFWYVTIIPIHYTLVVATGIASIFYLACWLQDNSSKSLMLSALWACAASFSHFDIWMLVGLETLVVFAASWRRGGWERLRGDGALWSIVAFGGVALFVFMNLWWAGNPLQFLAGFHGSGNVIREAHKGIQALFDYPRAVWAMAGPVLTITGALGSLMFAWRYRRQPGALVALLMLYPLIFFTVQVATSGSIIEPGQDLGSWRNLRYAVTLMPALCWFTVMGPRRRWMAYLLCALALAAAVPQVWSGQVAAWKDAKHDLDTGGRYGGTATQVLNRANLWLRVNAGQEKILIPVHSVLQDRLEWSSRIPAGQFIDSNDADLPKYEGMNVQQLKQNGVGWIITMSETLDAPAPALPGRLEQSGNTPCARFDDRLGKTMLSVWSTNTECPA